MTPLKNKTFNCENEKKEFFFSEQNSDLQTPIRCNEGEQRKRISYCMSSKRRQNLQKIIRERNFTEKSDVINKLGGIMKAASIESQIVCLERDQMVDLLLTACADYPGFSEKKNASFLVVARIFNAIITPQVLVNKEYSNVSL